MCIRDSYSLIRGNLCLRTATTSWTTESLQPAYPCRDGDLNPRPSHQRELVHSLACTTTAAWTRKRMLIVFFRNVALAAATNFIRKQSLNPKLCFGSIKDQGFMRIPINNSKTLCEWRGSKRNGKSTSNLSWINLRCITSLPPQKPISTSTIFSALFFALSLSINFT